MYVITLRYGLKALFVREIEIGRWFGDVADSLKGFTSLQRTRAGGDSLFWVLRFLPSPEQPEDEMPNPNKEAGLVAHRIESGECADPGSLRTSFKLLPETVTLLASYSVL